MKLATPPMCSEEDICVNGILWKIYVNATDCGESLTIESEVGQSLESTDPDA